MDYTQLELFPKEEQPQEQPQFQQAEWCFQFFDNEPVVFAWSESDDEAGELVLKIEPIDASTITFSHKGMEFKLFARPMSEETRLAKEKRKLEIENNQ